MSDKTLVLAINVPHSAQDITDRLVRSIKEGDYIQLPSPDNGRIIQFINLIRGQLPYEGAEYADSAVGITTEVFTQGNCGNFAQALVLAFGGTVVVADSNHHCLAAIGDRYYDITGDVTDQYTSVFLPSIVQLEDMTDNYSFMDRGPML